MNQKTKKIITGSAVIGAVILTALGAYALTGDSLNNAPVIGTIKTAIDPAAAKVKEIDNNTPLATSSYLSPSDIVSNAAGTLGFVADETSSKIYSVNLSTNSIISARTINVGSKVSALYYDETNDILYVGSKTFGGTLTKYKTASTNPTLIASTATVGHTPSAIVKVGTKVFVASRFTNEIVMHNDTDPQNAFQADNTRVTIPVSREPFAMAVAKSRIYVAHHLQDGAANNKKGVSAKVTVIDPATETVVKELSLPNGSESVKGIAASSDGSYVFATHILARYAYPTSQLDRGWINTNAMSILKASTTNANIDYYNTILLDDVDNGTGNPWGVGVTTAKKIVVASSGTQEAIILDETAMLTKISQTASGTYSRTYSKASDIPNYVNFSESFKTRLKLPADTQNPRELSVSGNKVFINNYISGNVAAVDLSAATPTTATIGLGTQPPDDQVRRGERLWYDATLCYQQWESCASCHPDARMDSINWDNLNDGMGNPKSAKSMLYSHRTPPAMARGIRETAERGVRAGMQFIQFNTLSEADMSNIDKFLMSLQPERSPYLTAAGTLSTSVDLGNGDGTGDATLGKALFEQSCTSCHSGPLFTNNKNVPSALYNKYTWEDGLTYNVPSLAEVWRTAPFGINGAYNSIYKYVEASLNKQSSPLTTTQRKNIAAYVMSLGDEGEVYGVEQVRVKDDNATNFHAAASYNEANILIPGTKITEITFRRQNANATQDGKATFTMYNSSNAVIGTPKTIDLSKTMNMRGAVSLDMQNYTVPNDADHYIVTIEDKNSPGTQIATPFRVDKHQP